MTTFSPFSSSPAGAPDDLPADAVAGVPRVGLRVGLVLAGGGEVGIAWHAVVLDMLAQWSGWDPRQADLAVGTSAGSWLCALLRAGIAPSDVVALATDDEIASPDDAVAQLGAPPVLPPAGPPWPLWPPSSPRLVGKVPRRNGVRAFSVISGLLPEGRLHMADSVAGLERIHGDRWPSLPTWVCAVDLESGARTVFGRKDAPPAHLADAVAASCAVPAYFAPVVIGGRRYIDGGAHSIANLDLCAGLDLDLVIVSSPLGGPRPRRGLDADAMARRVVARQLRRESDVVRDSGTPVVVIGPEPDDLRVMGRVTDAMDRSRRRPVVERVRVTLGRRLDHGLVGRELAALRR